MTDRYTQTVRTRPGDVIVVGRALYGRCAECNKMVRLNKWLLGSIHPCPRG